MDLICNRTFEELEVGDSARLERTLTRRDIELFAVMSGDVNPAHVDEEYARSDMFNRIIAHGMWSGALFSTVLGTELPGPGTIYLGQTLKFTAPVSVGDTVTVTVTVQEKEPEKHRLKLECVAVNQHGKTVTSGIAHVIGPTEKVRRPRVVLPTVSLHERGKWHREQIAAARSGEPIRAAVIYPVDRVALLDAVEAAREGLVQPVLYGPEDEIRAAADAESIDINGCEVMAAPDAPAAAALAVEAARDGAAGMLIQGALSTGALMRALTHRNAGVRKGRMISHVFALDAPAYARMLMITDGLLNVTPDLDTKREIVRNAVEFAQALGNPQPHAAVLSITSEVVASVQSSRDAAKLSELAAKGAFPDAVVDGPLAYDHAVSAEAARADGVDSPVAGRADILVMPNLETGNMLIRQLTSLADAQTAGVVLGAVAPIVLVHRTHSALARMAACALAKRLAQAEMAAPAEV